MANQFDLNVLPIFRKDGHDQEDTPGILVATAPRRKAARGRVDDLLVIDFALDGNATIAPDGQARILSGLAHTYYQTGGAVTTAIRAAFDSLNEFLFTRNNRSAEKGLQVRGLLTMLVAHRDHLYIAQSGPTHTYTIAQDEAQHFSDAVLAGPGLGLGRTAKVRMNYIPLEPGDFIVLTPSPASHWTASKLSRGQGKPLEAFHHFLVRELPDDFRASIVEVQAGKGKISLLPPRASDSIPPPLESTIPSTPEPDTPEPFENDFTDPDPISPPRVEIEPEQVDTSPSSSEVSPPKKKEERPPREPVVGPMLLRMWDALMATLKQFGQSLRVFLSRMLPGNELFTLASSTMIFMAIAVPIVLVTVASVVYIQRGRLARYATCLGEAEAARLFAEGQSDLANVRLGWEAVLDRVACAENAYQVTEDTQLYRAQAYAVLDGMNNTQRLEFFPVLETELPETYNIGRMLAVQDELYLLNSEGGNIVRAFLTGNGYTVDTEFQCGPGIFGSHTVVQLIDLAPLPRNNSLNAAIMAIDKNGILVYCIPGAAPLAQPLGIPDSGWGNPLAFTLDSGSVYVLDPETNAVWIYDGIDYSFVNRPYLFFDDTIPEMQDVIDIAVNRSDLYMLHANGQITTCIFGFGANKTQCTTPTPYTDPRPGSESGQVFEGAIFNQVTYTPPPDPSLYLFDPVEQAIYHFSLRLTFQRQFRALYPVPEALGTTFAVNANQQVFIAVGNQVRYAQIP